MDAFLLWIGGYNVAGGLVLAAMHEERVADTVLSARHRDHRAAVPTRRLRQVVVVVDGDGPGRARSHHVAGNALARRRAT
jgi:hypothetical protein